jgi:tRNA(fMet)-specific endonuclease VapC
LAKHLEAHFSITFTVLGELACGRSASPRQTWEQLTRPFSVISWTREVSWQYGEIYRVLRERGELIGANDLWIAATAITHGLPVVTGNLNEFRRVKNLEVVSF